MTPYPGAATPGTMTPGFATSSRLDLNQIGEARNSILGIKLDQVRMRSGSHVASLDTRAFLAQILFHCEMKSGQGRPGSRLGTSQGA